MWLMLIGKVTRPFIRHNIEINKKNATENIKQAGIRVEKIVS